MDGKTPHTPDIFRRILWLQLLSLLNASGLWGQHYDGHTVQCCSGEWTNSPGYLTWTYRDITK